MNWSGYTWLHVKLTRILQKLRTRWIQWYVHLTYEPQHNKTNNMACAPSEDSDQPGHPPSLIKVFAVSMEKAWILIATHWAHSKDSDQTGRMPKLIWVFAGRTFCRVFVCLKKVWVRIAIHRAYSEDSDQTGRMTVRINHINVSIHSCNCWKNRYRGV